MFCCSDDSQSMDCTPSTPASPPPAPPPSPPSYSSYSSREVDASLQEAEINWKRNRGKRIKERERVMAAVKAYSSSSRQSDGNRAHRQQQQQQPFQPPSTWQSFDASVVDTFSGPQQQGRSTSRQNTDPSQRQSEKLFQHAYKTWRRGQKQAASRRSNTTHQQLQDTAQTSLSRLDQDLAGMSLDGKKQTSSSSTSLPVPAYMIDDDGRGDAHEPAQHEHTWPGGFTAEQHTEFDALQPCYGEYPSVAAYMEAQAEAKLMAALQRWNQDGVRPSSAPSASRSVSSFNRSQ